MTMTDDQLPTMLRELVEAPGVPGQERAVRDVMQHYLAPLGEIITDNLGGIAAKRTGDANGPAIVVAGHMDEIGFMVTRITDEGYLKFQTLGGWWEQVMLAQRVRVYTRNGSVIGIIGSKPPHILEPEERKKMVEKKQMYVDIGAASADEARAWGVHPGDPIVPVGDYTPMHNPRMVMAKAWDNRFGCAAAIEVLRHLQNEQHPNIVYGVGNVQEEVGLRGATTMTNRIAPDIGIALDTGIAGDTPGIDPDSARGKLGAGPTILMYDASMIPHTGLRDLVLDTAEEHDIPLQVDVMARGGTDAGRMHLFGAGVPAIVLGVPVRYIHTHSAILHLDDFAQLIELLGAVIKRLDSKTVATLKAG